MQEEASILGQSNHASVDIQQKNIRLQRQVQYLHSRVANSAPTNNLPDKSSTLQNRTESNDQNERKPKLDTRQSVTIIGDSIINYQDERLHTNKQRIAKVRSHPGATSEDLVDHFTPIAKRAPDVIILHVGMKDFNKRDEDNIIKNIKKIKNGIVRISPKTNVLIFLIISGYDDDNLNDKGVLVNCKFRRELPKSDIIDNSNPDRHCVGLKGLLLNTLGNKHLALNFKVDCEDHF